MVYQIFRPVSTRQKGIAMYSDYHLHTCFSGDSDTPPRAQIERAIALGMDTICLTDHQDFDFPPSELVFVFDTGKYFRELSALRDEYSDRIDVRIGVELGLQPYMGELLSWYARTWPFDFIIGSTHVSRGLDPYEKEFWAGIDEETAIRTYFEEERANLLSTDAYDVAGHLDFVLRYCSDPAGSRALPRYADLFDDVLRHLVEQGKGLECNTSGLRSGQGFPNPHPDLLKRYRELGGEIITLGSDAHETKDVGHQFTIFKDLLADCGFRYYAIYKERKPEFRKL